MSGHRFPHYQQMSGWNAMLAPRRANASLTSDIDVDIAIIGAGYTGISAAKRWRELAADDEIAIIDSSEVGEGSPGRNSGFLLEIALANDANPEQMQRMAKCNQLISATMERIVSEVRSSGVDCGLERSGTYRAAAGNAGRKSLRRYRSFLAAADLPFEELDRSDLRRRLGTDYYQEGLYSPHCYLAQPAALIRALVQQMPSDIQLYENTPAMAIRRSANDWIIETPEAVIRAPKVILANNAFCKDLGIGKSQLVNIYTYAGISKPLGKSILDSLGSEKSWGLLPAHRLGSTLRRTRDGRLLIRSQYDYEQESQPEIIARELGKNLLSRFPQLDEPEFEHVWGGAVGFTFNGGPLWGEVKRPDGKRGLYVSAGCNGGGVVKGTLFGRLLAELANGREVADVRSLFGEASWMPPEPLRKIGFHLVSALERVRGRAEI